MTPSHNKGIDSKGIKLSQGGRHKRRRLYKKMVAGITKKKLPKIDWGEPERDIG